MDGYALAHDVRVRFAETDAQGIAHHASFVVWLEEARVAYLAEYAERPFDFYFRQGPGRYRKVRLPYTNYPGMTEPEGLQAVATSLRGDRTLWIVRFEDWLWDGRDLTRKYLTSRGARPVLQREFSGVSVTRYEFP